MQLRLVALLTTLALSTSTAPADAEQAKCDGANCAPQELAPIKINPLRNSIYKVEHWGDIRCQAEICDIPQTIKVLTKDPIDESEHRNLHAILCPQVKVSLDTAENGNAFGDRYIICGHEARSCSQ